MIATSNMPDEVECCTCSVLLATTKQSRIALMLSCACWYRMAQICSLYGWFTILAIYCLGTTLLDILEKRLNFAYYFEHIAYILSIFPKFLAFLAKIVNREDSKTSI